MISSDTPYMYVHTYIEPRRALLRTSGFWDMYPQHYTCVDENLMEMPAKYKVPVSPYVFTSSVQKLRLQSSYALVLSYRVIDMSLSESSEGQLWGFVLHASWFA